MSFPFLENIFKEADDNYKENTSPKDLEVLSRVLQKRKDKGSKKEEEDVHGRKKMCMGGRRCAWEENTVEDLVVIKEHFQENISFHKRVKYDK